MSTNKAVFYQPLKNEIEVFEKAYACRLPILLQGPTGCGKSRFVEYCAQIKEQPLITVACNEDTSASDLLGRFLLMGGDTVWQDGPVTRAVRDSAILYLDEVAEAREDVVVLLHSLADHRRELYIDRKNETLRASDRFQLVVSYNPGYQRGLKELKPSTRQRFVAMTFDFAEPSLEVEIVKKETDIESAIAQKLVDFAIQIRKLEDLQLVETVSTRLLVHTAQLIKAGLSIRSACDVGMAQPLTDDRQTLQALRDLIGLRF
jgi:nitric oxide reductase NorQ protein